MGRTYQQLAGEPRRGEQETLEKRKALLAEVFQTAGKQRVREDDQSAGAANKHHLHQRREGGRQSLTKLVPHLSGRGRAGVRAGKPKAKGHNQATVPG